MFYRFVIIPVGILVASIVASATEAGTIVQFNFNYQVEGTNGPISYFQLELFDNDAPITVTNFLRYVNDGRYDNMIVHRSVEQFVVQGGGYIPVVENGLVTALNSIANYGTIQNEFSLAHSNVRGTIGMARFVSDPDSATSQWFINVVDNSANLDYQGGGFTIFGQVLNEGMTLIDAINNLPTYDLSGYYGGVFHQVPRFNSGSSFVIITSATVVPEPSSLILLAIAGLYFCSCAWRKRWGGTDKRN